MDKNIENDLTEYFDGAAFHEIDPQRNPARRSPGSNLGRRRVDIAAGIDADVDQVVDDASRDQDDQLLDRCHHEQRATEQRSFKTKSKSSRTNLR